MANSHKREANARRTPKAALVAGPIAFVVTACAVTLGVLAGHPQTRDVAATQDLTTRISQTRSAVVSRSETRRDLVEPVRKGVTLQREYTVDLSPAAVAAAVRGAHTKVWTTTVVNLWTTPGTDAAHVGEVPAGKPVLATGREDAGRQEVVVGGAARWITTGYVTANKPVPAVAKTTTPAAASTGLSTAPCPDGSVENGLTSGAVSVYRAVCHAYPQITTYGGWDAHGEHASGKAIDIMTSDKALGDQIAAFLQSHASELDLYDIIWWDRIWTPVRASEGWRDYGDHGSPTANHMDHVHVSVN